MNRFTPSRTSFFRFALVALALLSTQIAFAANCVRVNGVAPGGCRARFGGGLIEAETAHCNFSMVDCNQDGRPDLNVPHSDVADPAIFTLKDLCPGLGVAEVRFRFICGVANSQWRAYDATGAVVDQKNVPATGAPQWVRLRSRRGQCIERVELVTQETCIIGICWRCKLHLKGKIPDDSSTTGEPDDDDPGIVPHVNIPLQVHEDGTEYGQFNIDIAVESQVSEEQRVRGFMIAALCNNEVIDGIFAGTDAADLINDTGFFRAQIGSSGLDGIFDPNRTTPQDIAGIGSSGQDGVCVRAAAVFGTGRDDELPSTGEFCLLRLTAEIDENTDKDPIRLRILDNWEHAASEEGAPVLERATMSNRNGDLRPSTGDLVFTAGLASTGTTFVRGDVDGSGSIELTDAIFGLQFLFLGGDAPNCLDAADVNDDSTVDLSDSLTILQFKFLGGAAPSAPYPSCGVDPSEDRLECAVYRACN